METKCILSEWLKLVSSMKVSEFRKAYPNEEAISDELVPILSEGTRYQLGYRSSEVSEQQLLEVWKKFRGTRGERDLWECIIWYLSHPLPVEIAHDLIDRNISDLTMAHTCQADKILARLAPHIEEALFALIKIKYASSSYSADDFEMDLLKYKSDYRDVEDMNDIYSALEQLAPHQQKRKNYSKM